jgi:hypothetical protein
MAGPVGARLQCAIAQGSRAHLPVPAATLQGAPVARHPTFGTKETSMTHPAYVRHGANGFGLNGYGRAKTSDPSNLEGAINGSGLRVHLDTTETKPRPMSFYDK